MKNGKKTFTRNMFETFTMLQPYSSSSKILLRVAVCVDLAPPILHTMGWSWRVSNRVRLMAIRRTIWVQLVRNMVKSVPVRWASFHSTRHHISHLSLH